MTQSTSASRTRWVLTASVEQIVMVCTGLAAIFVALDVAATLFTYFTGHDHVFGLLALIDLDQERGFGMLLQVFFMFFGATLFFAVAAAADRDRAPEGPWKFMGFVFLFLMLDEFSSLHERLLPISRELFGSEGFLYFAWILPYGAAAALLLLWVAPKIFRLPREPRFLLILAGFVYVCGAAGMEGVSGWYMHSIGGESANPDVVYHLLTTIEEALEMAGVIIMIRALLGMLRESWTDVSLQLLD